MAMPRLSHTLPLIALAGLLVVGFGCGDKTPPVTDPTSDPTSLGNPRENFALGVRVLEQGKSSGKTDYDKAYAYFNNATIVDDTYAKAHYNAGWVAEKLGRLPEAEAHYRKAFAADGSYSSALLSLAGVLSQQGRSAEAIDLYKGYVTAHPSDLAVRNSLVTAYISGQQYDQAILEIREVLSLDKKNIEAYTNLSRVYYAQGNYPMSQLAAEKARTLNEADANIYNSRGVTYLKQSNAPAAIAEFKTAIKLDANIVRANMHLGWVALNSGDYPLALDCFTKVTNQQPGNVDALMGLAVAQRGSHQLDEAATTYDTILKLAPDSQAAYFNAATLYEMYRKEYKKALDILQVYVDSHQGQLTPSDEVFARMERVRQSQAAEDERIRIAKAEEEKAKERERKMKEQFEQLRTSTDAFQVMMDKYGTCPAVVEMGLSEMGATLLEQARAVIEANDTSSAADTMSFLTDIDSQMQAIIPSCPATAPAPAPAPEGTPVPAPAPEGTPAPTEGTPAGNP